MQRRDLLKFSVSLLGAAAGTSVSRALAAGADLHQGTATAAFSADQRKAVELLSEMIIPTTDTPGAIAAGVPDFITSIVGDWYKPNEREIFMQGLVSLDGYCREHGGKPFSESAESTRIDALKAEEAAAKDYASPQQMRMKVPKEDENAPFFKRLKELVVLGYYTSEVGATEELKYLPMPGYFDGSYDFNKVGREFTH
ncbi:gluconate 2-dehydrogenase subunit 3 family protein [Haliea sp. E17]|uniref:gluconate 2-dehydrogenase subunit 3 family protein n=1 Tax=Haliea sp. E17 TaxID=3401576 RepID=UPI003AAB47BC